jgi:LuxR family transcriptional regulator, maltose regulon positive regulatory protein
MPERRSAVRSIPWADPHDGPAGSDADVAGRSTPAGTTRPALVRRERLHALLDDTLDRAWSIISAPAGCGKSSLLATWLPTLTGRAETLHLADGDLGEQLSALPERRPADALRRVIVVDPRRALPRRDWQRLADLVDADPDLTVVAATRTDPPLPIGRLVVAGDLAEIRTRDLRWTRAEVRQLLAADGLALTPDAVDLLCARTAGWSAGLKLAIAGAARAQDPYAFLRDFAQDDRATVEYLSDEVFAGLPERLQHLLAMTASIAGTADLTADSAAAVSGMDDAPALLDRLTDEGLLCTADGTGGLRRYRYHPLLLSMLRRRTTTGTRAAHERAAHWHAAHARPAAALADASVAGAPDLIAGLLLEHGPALLEDAGDRSAMSRAFSALPPRWRDTYSYLLPLAGLLHVLRGDPGAALQNLTDAERRRTASWPAAAAHDALALHAWAAGRGWRDGRRTFADADRLGLIAARGAPVATTGIGPARESVLFGRLGILAMWYGPLEAADAHLETATRPARSGVAGGYVPGRGGPGSLLRRSIAHHALLMAVNGRARTGAGAARDALAGHDDPAFDRQTAAVGHLALAWSAYLRGVHAEARTELARADAGVEETEPLIVLLAATLRGRLVLATDGPVAAHTALLGVADLAGTAPEWARTLWATTELRITASLGMADGALAGTSRMPADGPEATFMRAVYALHAGDPVAARALLEPLATGEVAFVIPWGRVKASVLEAGAAHLLGDTQGAARGLLRTLMLGAPEELVQPLAEPVTGVPGPLELLDAHPDVVTGAGADDYVDALRERLPELAPARRAAGPVPGSAAATAVAAGRLRFGPTVEVDAALLAGADALTGREREVLILLDSVAPMSTIARRLYVSTNTLKTHVGAIYRKLGADGRADAVDRAYTLGLLPTAHRPVGAAR